MATLFLFPIKSFVCAGVINPIVRNLVGEDIPRLKYTFFQVQNAYRNKSLKANHDYYVCRIVVLVIYVEVLSTYTMSSLSALIS